MTDWPDIDHLTLADIKAADDLIKVAACAAIFARMGDLARKTVLENIALAEGKRKYD